VDTETMTAGQLAALDQAVAAYREACRVFASTPGTGEQMRAEETLLREVGRDEVSGLVTLPVAAVHFSDERADGARLRAVNGSLLGGETWMLWAGRSLPCGIESRTYDAWDLVQVKAR
jgi:hypothetical protein